jgi:hypothetical protein
MATIPSGAIIDNVRVRVVTAFTDNDADLSTIGITIESSQDIKQDAAIGTDFTVGVKINSWHDFVFTEPILTTADRKVTATVKMAGAATAISTGNLEIYVEYFI